MRSTIGLALTGVTALGAASAASAATAAPTRTPAQLAKAALIGYRDLGAGWYQSAAAPRRAPQLVCRQPAGPQPPRERARPASPTFSQSQQGPFVFQISGVFHSVPAADRWWGALVRPSQRRCFAAELQAASSGGVRMHATGSRMLALPGAPRGLVRYRITGVAVSSGQSTPVDFDVLLLRRGAEVGELQLSSFGTPPADGLEARLARAVHRRLLAT
jgi:hypothetical protein